jgi:hypothetical protein
MKGRKNNFVTDGGKAVGIFMPYAGALPSADSSLSARVGFFIEGGVA